jgi:RNA polymerase sigma-70 factor (ECF subfamily)
MTLIDECYALDGRLQWSDSSLMVAVIARDEAAFTELFRRHAASVGRASRVVLRNDRACGDVVAEVFLGLWLSPDKFDPELGTLLGYLRMKARSMSIDMLRSEARRRRRDTNGIQHPDDSNELDACVLATEDADRLRDAVASLPSGQREPIQLAYFSGLTYRAVALYLSVPEGTVKSRIRGGLQQLRMLETLQLRRTLGKAMPQSRPVSAQRAASRISARS